MPQNTITGQCLVAGAAEDSLLVSDVGLSFWGRVNSASGKVIDQHHPLRGNKLSGRILAIPNLVGRKTHFGSLTECAAVARSGYRTINTPTWLQTTS